jgi:hypothetical protein
MYQPAGASNQLPATVFHFSDWTGRRGYPHYQMVKPGLSVDDVEVARDTLPPARGISAPVTGRVLAFLFIKRSLL